VSFKKRREAIIFGIIFALILAVTLLFWSLDGITGASIGILPDLNARVDNSSEFPIPVNEPELVRDNSTENEDVLLITEELTIQDANGSQCGDVNGNIVLTTNIISNNGTCFTINANHVIIDGMGFNLTGNKTGETIFWTDGHYGILEPNNNESSNITIKNFGNIGGFDIGINVYGSNNVTIFNNTIYNNSYGVYVITTNKDLNISYNMFRNNSRGIAYDETSDGNVWINFNNFTNNTFGMEIESSSVHLNQYNFSYNNFYNNSFNFRRTRAENLTLENNWWGAADCVNISKNMSGSLNNEFSPFLDTPYPTGASVDCPAQYCGMPIFNFTTLTANLENCPGRGIIIGANDVILNCTGRSIIGASGNSEIGIYAKEYDRINITNCKIVGFNESIRFGGVSTESASASTDGLISNNTIINFTGTGIFIRRSSNGNDIINNTITYANSNSSGAMILGSSSNTIKENNFSHNRPRAVYVSEIHNNFDRNFLLNNSVGYNLAGSANNFTNERIYNHSSGVLIDSDAASYINNVMTNCLFDNNAFDINLESTSSSNLTLMNSTINKSKINTDIGGTVYIRWYVFINVSDTLNNSLLSNATAYTSLDGAEFRNNTDSLGLGRLEMTEYYRNAETDFYLTPGRIVISKDNYTENTTSVNLIDQTFAQFNITLTQITCGSTITSNFRFGNSYLCDNASLTIGRDNIIIDGNGYNLTATGDVISDVGVYINNRKNIVLKNLLIGGKYTTGVYLFNTNDSNITGIKMSNMTRGITINNSHNNIISDSNLSNGTGILAISTGNTNNSLVNISINMSLVDVTANSSIFLKWYVDVNTTFNGKNPLSGVDVYGYFNSSGTLDKSTTSGSNGMSRLTLTELKKNSSETEYLTPHNVTSVFVYQSANITNSTTFNLTKTGNIKINLSVVLNCTALSGRSTTLSADTTICPGSYNNQLKIGANHIMITCIESIISNPTGYGLDGNGKDNFTIKDCTFSQTGSGYVIALGTAGGSDDVKLYGLTITATGTNWALFCSNSNRLKIVNSSTSSIIGYGVWLTSCSHAEITNVTFTGKYGISLRGSHNNTIKNSTFTDVTTAILFKPTSASQTLYSDNNSFYYNKFSGTGTYVDYESTSGYNNSFNTSVGGYGIGNEWGNDYCGKGADLNSDGYADNVSSATAGDWPYNQTVGTRITVSGGTSVVDYGPKITTCPPAEVFLGSGGEATGGAKAAAASAAGAPAPPAPAPAGAAKKPTPPPAPVEEYYSAEDAKKFLKTEKVLTQTIDPKITLVTVTLENTGTQRMLLFPKLFQEVEDPFFIVTRKTLGFEGSFLTKLASISYSPNRIVGRLLTAEILDAEDIVVNPGEKVERTLELKEGLVLPRQIKIQFTSFGETVLEQEIEIKKEVISGTAVDLDTQENLLDIYAVIAPAEELQERSPGNNQGKLTGAVVLEKDQQQVTNYFLELNINKKVNGKEKTSYGDIYGPYSIKPGKSLIFAQQFVYDPAIFAGNYSINAKIYREKNIVVENKFDVKFE